MPRPPVTDVVLVALGGAIGSAGRHAVLSDAVPAAGLRVTVAATLVIGCLALGLVLGATTRSPTNPLRVFAIGLCGGFASFSLYAVVGSALSTAWIGVVFLVVTPVVALAAMAAGALLTASIVRR
ncbi:CrcB family protein [Rhodococcus sp. NBC_00294]|uniref:CrcB family protein n=1 Tax=Rhodococcus sp. NBC_00294 TaxID=2976004 RepID=UPI002E2B21EA|nr:CrcB family protein [Rhodococcus sp. NBC_00294]